MAGVRMVLARSGGTDERKSGQGMRACIKYAGRVRRNLLTSPGSQASAVGREQCEAGRLRIPIVAPRRQPQWRATRRRERKIDDRIRECVYDPTPYGREPLIDMSGLRREKRL